MDDREHCAHRRDRGESAVPLPVMGDGRYAIEVDDGRMFVLNTSTGQVWFCHTTGGGKLNKFRKAEE